MTNQKHQDTQRSSFISRFVLKTTRENLRRIELAYDKAQFWHRKQKRDNGIPYFEHLMATAILLVDELGVTDPDLIILALIHDTLEDQRVSADRIKKLFGSYVAMAEMILSKPKKEYCRRHGISDEKRHEDYRAQLLVAAPEVLIVKLADRLHNIRTLGVCSIDKRRRKIIETAEFYLPLIERVRPVYPLVANLIDEKLREAIREAKVEIKPPNCPT